MEDGKSPASRKSPPTATGITRFPGQCPGTATPALAQLSPAPAQAPQQHPHKEDAVTSPPLQQPHPLKPQPGPDSQPLEWSKAENHHHLLPRQEDWTGRQHWEVSWCTHACTRTQTGTHAAAHTAPHPSSLPLSPMLHPASFVLSLCPGKQGPVRAVPSTNPPPRTNAAPLQTAISTPTRLVPSGVQAGEHGMPCPPQGDPTAPRWETQQAQPDGEVGGTAWGWACRAVSPRGPDPPPAQVHSDTMPGSSGRRGPGRPHASPAETG